MDTKKLKPPPGSRRFNLRVLGDGSDRCLYFIFDTSFMRGAIPLEILDEFFKEDAACVAIVNWRRIRDYECDTIAKEKEASDQIRFWSDWGGIDL